MRLRVCAIAVVTVLLVAGCGDSEPEGSVELLCGEGASGSLSPGGAVAVTDSGAKDLAGAAIAADAKSTVPSDSVDIQCAEDIVPEGYVALGPAVTFGPAGSWSDRPFTFTLPFKMARMPDGGTLRHVRVVAKRHVGDGTPFFPPVSNRVIDDSLPFASRVSFRAGEMVTYQVVADERAGQTYQRRYTWRAIAGISMGGNASMSIGLRNHDEFDFIVDLGGEPGPSMKYTLSMMRDYLFGGFCTARHEAEGKGRVGEMCAFMQRPVLADQLERSSNYEAFLYEEGDGVGLTLDRDLYVRASRDLSRAMGNPAMYNPDNPYVPTGVAPSILLVPAAERCANPVVLDDFYDREFNPDGSHPVITFCDGGDSDVLGKGVFDPSLPQTEPVEIMLAVDLNGNGRRDAGEPVLTNAFEPFDDVGSDGIPDEQETGVLGDYDPVINPDPAGDNWHWQRNPTGTERNFDHDDGEPFEDVGLDGVASTCQHGDDAGSLGVAGCYDIGEGDGEWTLSPNVARWYDSDIDVLLSRMTEEDKQRVNFWFDAGIRDFLNGGVSANTGIGAIAANDLQVGVSDGFSMLHGEEHEQLFDFGKLRWDEQPRNMYLRYGDPDADQDKIENGDGRHVGTGIQIINRVTTSFTWLQAQWPNGDRDDVGGPGQIFDDLSFVTSGGRETPYSVFLPPGYDDPTQADKSYPVVYFLHGYGQEPKDLVLLSGVFENYMVNDVLNGERFQKFIMVYVDGRCRPNQDGVPVPQDGDGCEGGTFYLDSPIPGNAQMENNLWELVEHIDATYRVRPPETVEVPY